MSAHLPNIVFITTDTQGREMLSCYAQRPGVDTPHLDALARDSVVFDQCYTASPVCTPARSAWYTGRHPNRSGAWGNEMTIGQHVPMLADLLREQGYTTDHVGKWHLDGAGYSGAGRADGGFDGETWYDLANFYDEVGRDGMNRFGGWTRGLDDIELCYGHRVADRAISTLKRRRDDGQPFFLAVEFDEPHGPYICPPPFRGRFTTDSIYQPPTFRADMGRKPQLQQDYAAYMAAQRSNPEAFPGYYSHYYDCNSYADYEIGRVIEAIDAYAPDTIIVFTSDHGDHLGAFDMGAKGPTMYDHTTRVPLLVRAPGLTDGGRVSDGLVSSVDVWTTILDLAGVDLAEARWFKPQNGYSGRSLGPVLRGEADHVRDSLVVEYNRFGKQFDQFGGLYPIRCLVTPDWKLSINLFDTDELYDRQADPEETDNRIDDPALDAVRRTLHDALLAWQTETHDVFRNSSWGRRAWRPDYRAPFEGLLTTGYRDPWPYGTMG